MLRCVPQYGQCGPYPSSFWSEAWAYLAVSKHGCIPNVSLYLIFLTSYLVQHIFLPTKAIVAQGKVAETDLTDLVSRQPSATLLLRRTIVSCRSFSSIWSYVSPELMCIDRAHINYQPYLQIYSHEKNEYSTCGQTASISIPMEDIHRTGLNEKSTLIALLVT